MPEPAIWSRDTGQRIACCDSCQLTIAWMPKNQRCSHGNGATLLVFKVMAYGRTDGLTDSHVTTKIFQIDRLPHFLRYGAPLARLRRAGAPLIHYHNSILRTLGTSEVQDLIHSYDILQLP